MKNNSFSSYYLWEIDPVLFQFKSIQVYYYGILFIIGFFLGYLIWYRQMVRGGHNRDLAYYYFFWAFIATIVGARLGECFFYDPQKYLKDPIKIFMIYKGGLSSHGATIGLVTSLFLFAKYYRFSFIEVLDRFAMSPLMAAIFVRLGNFMNSEIVGKEWHGPWAVRFSQHAESLQYKWEVLHGQLGYQIQALPRHPSQLYEALGGFIVFLLLYFVDRRLKEDRPRGLMCGLFFLGYFLFRFFIEFFKEYQTFNSMKLYSSERVIREMETSIFTMGQYLSIPFIILGLSLIVWAFKKRLPAVHTAPSDNKKGRS